MELLKELTKSDVVSEKTLMKSGVFTSRPVSSSPTTAEGNLVAASVPGGRRGISSYQDITLAYNTKHPKSNGSDPPNLSYALQVCYFVNLFTINALSAMYSVLIVLKY